LARSVEAHVEFGCTSTPILQRMHFAFGYCFQLLQRAHSFQFGNIATGLLCFFPTNNIFPVTTTMMVGREEKRFSLSLCHAAGAFATHCVYHFASLSAVVLSIRLWHTFTVCPSVAGAMFFLTNRCIRKEVELMIRTVHSIYSQPGVRTNQTHTVPTFLSW